MLDAFIIEQLRKRERQQQEDNARPVLELPLPEERAPEERERGSRQEKEEGERGVVIIDFGS